MTLIHVRLLRALNIGRRGVTALEYGLLGGIIVGAIAIGFSQLANSLSTQFSNIGGSL